MKKLIILSFVFSLYSCTQKLGTPEASLREFINYRYSKDQSKDKLLSMTTGKFQFKINEMSDDEFTLFTGTSNLQKRSFKVVTSNCQKETCFITFISSYNQFQEKEKEFVVETKKIAELTKEEESWKISDVTELKTHIEALKNIE